MCFFSSNEYRRTPPPPPILTTVIQGNHPLLHLPTYTGRTLAHTSPLSNCILKKRKCTDSFLRNMTLDTYLTCNPVFTRCSFKNRKENLYEVYGTFSPRQKTMEFMILFPCCTRRYRPQRHQVLDKTGIERC